MIDPMYFEQLLLVLIIIASKHDFTAKTIEAQCKYMKAKEYSTITID